MKNKKNVGCIFIAVLFAISIICIMLSIDDKTGKADPNKYYFFIPTGLLLIVLFVYLIKSVSHFISGFGELPGLIEDAAKNIEFVGKNGIRGKYLKIFGSSSSLSSLLEMKNPFNFICPNCLKTILAENIHDVICPYCDKNNEGFSSLFLACPKCGGVIKYYECPHCHKEIDLLSDYNEKELIDKRFN